MYDSLFAGFNGLPVSEVTRCRWLPNDLITLLHGKQVDCVESTYIIHVILIKQKVPKKWRFWWEVKTEISVNTGEKIPLENLVKYYTTLSYGINSGNTVRQVRSHYQKQGPTKEKLFSSTLCLDNCRVLSQSAHVLLNGGPYKSCFEVDLVPYSFFSIIQTWVGFITDNGPKPFQWGQYRTFDWLTFGNLTFDDYI